MKYTKSNRDRILEKVVHEKGPLRTPCWMFTGSRTAKGYGTVGVKRDDGSFKTTRAHRAMFEIDKRPLRPDEMCCHRCDRPGCVNPDHLFAGTATVNRRDCVTKGRARFRKHCDPKLVAKLRREYRKGVSRGWFTRVAAAHNLKVSTLWRQVVGRKKS